MRTVETPIVGRYDRDRYVPEQLPEDDRGRRDWAVRDRRTGELLQDGGEVDRFPWRDGAELRAQQQHDLDSVRR